MHIYLIVAYGVFILVPLVLAVSIYMRRRRVERKIGDFQIG
jgi:hypothetical protein